MIYTYKNIDVNLSKLEITGLSGVYVTTKSQEFFCNDLSLDLSTSIDSSYAVGTRFVDNYVPSDGIKGSLKISYYITGNDLIREFFSDDKADISGNIAGLTFNKGKVSNYSLRAEPNSPILVNADVVFFDQLSGTFSPVFKQAQEFDVSNYYNTVITDSSENVFGANLNVFNFDYSFSNEVNPVYKIESGVGGTIPSEINIGKKQASFTFNTDRITGVLPFSGQKVFLSVGIKDFTGALIDTIVITGNVSEKSISTSVDQIINNKITILQSNVGYKQIALIGLHSATKYKT